MVEVKKMAIKTTQEQLEEVQTAISNIMLYGQHIGAAFGRDLTNADLGALTARENMLLARYREENGQGITKNMGVIRRD
jgi:hypothetical protein